MQYEIPPTLETQLTGYHGTAIRQVGRVEYRVRFVTQAGELTAAPSRDGTPCDWTPTTRSIAENGFRFFGWRTVETATC